MEFEWQDTGNGIWIVWLIDVARNERGAVGEISSTLEGFRIYSAMRPETAIEGIPSRTLDEAKDRFREWFLSYNTRRNG